MLTLSATFESEFSKASVEPIILIEIYTTTGDPTLFCTGSKNISFTSITNPYGGSTGALVANPLVGMITPIATTLDPFTRTMVRNSVTVSFLAVEAIRDLVSGTRLVNRNVIIKLGTVNMTSEADWAPLFNGSISDINARPDGIDVECSDFLRFTDKAHYGTWVNRHPLEVIKRLLEEQGVPEEFIDDDLFDPLHADYADIAHYVVSYYDLMPFIWDPSNGEGNPVYNKDSWKHSGGDVFSPWASSKLLSETFAAVVHDLAKLMIGSLYFDEEGQVRFLRFLVDAPVRAHWDKDEIMGLTQLSNSRVNQIEMQISGGRNDGLDPFSGVVQFKDSTSQTNFTFPGETNGVFSQSCNFLQVNFHADLGNSIPSSGGFTRKIIHPWGLSGTRIKTGNVYSPGGYTWESSTHQDAGTKISADRPLYVLINNEVMKSVSIDLIENVVEYPMEYDQDGRRTMKARPVKMDLVVASDGRGQYGTEAQAHTDPMDPDSPTLLEMTAPIARVFDMTMHVEFADVQLQRFSNGCPIIEVYTSLIQWKVQVGDFVTVDDENYLAFGRDGLSSSTTWEVIEKELYLDQSSVQIKWKLAYATETSPPTVVGAYTWPHEDIRRGVGTINEIAIASEAEVGISRHTVMGLGASVSGLDVTIGSGTAASGGGAIPMNVSQTITVPASMDSYISLDLGTGAICLNAVATGAAEPALNNRELILAKAVAGGSSASLTDKREYGAVRPRNMSTIDFEAGGNLVANPSFETWSRGSGRPPDNWYVGSASTWDTDIVKSSTAYRGLAAIKLPTHAGSEKIHSGVFRVENNRAYTFGAAFQVSSGSTQVQISIEWLDEDKEVNDSNYLVLATGFSTGTWIVKNETFVAPDSTHYAKVTLGRNAIAGDVYFDQIRLVRSHPSFFVTNTTQTLTKAAPIVVDFDIEAHDIGGDFTPTLGQNKYTAATDGVYSFTAQILGSNLTNGHADSYVFLGKNGSELLRGTKSYTGTSAEYDYHIRTGPIVLAKDDYIQVVFFNSHASDSVLTGSTTQNYFSGRQIT